MRFEIDVKGDRTGKAYAGVFEAKTKLSWRETAREDEIRRGIIGVNPNDAAEFIQLGAACAAYLHVRLIETPLWWKDKDCNGGLDLQDQNVLVEVHAAAVKKINEEYEAHLAAAKTAQGELKAEAAKLG